MRALTHAEATALMVLGWWVRPWKLGYLWTIFGFVSKNSTRRRRHAVRFKEDLNPISNGELMWAFPNQELVDLVARGLGAARNV